MNLNIACFATVSKKLKKICQDNPLFLSIQPLNDGRMVARLKISCPDNIDIEDVKKIEDISIILEIDDVSEDVKDLGNETPIQNLYTSAERIENSKLAITDANNELKKYDDVKKVASSKKVEVLKEKIFPKPNVGKNFISNYDELEKILSAVKDIDKVVPQVPSNKKMNRTEAIEFGKVMQSVPRLPLGTYISNETGSRLCIDDLNLFLNINEIIDLSSIPAQKIKNSRQLKSCCERGYVKFRSKGEYNEWCKRQENIDVVDDKVRLKILDKKVDEYEAEEMLEPMEESKSTVALPSQSIPNKNAPLKKSSARPSTQTEIDENSVMDITGEEPTEGEKELSELLKDLPEEKEKDIEAEEVVTPLLSDEVEKSEKNKIKRVD